MEMMGRLFQIDRLLRGAVMAAVLVGAGCTDPAPVVLYEERHGRAPAAAPQPKPPAVRPPAPTRPPAAVVRAAPQPAAAAKYHQVRSGDTVYSVSQRYHVPLRGLITMNGLQAPYVLRSGQTLLLPKPRRHTVQRGETIYGISRQHEVALSRLVQFNGIKPPYTIIVRQVLRLPDSVASPNAAQTAQTPRARAPRPPASNSAKPVATPPSRGSSVTVAAKPPRAAIPKPPPLSKRKFLLPVRGRLLSRFGSKGRGLRNDGVNIAAPRGTPVRAVENGIVVYSGNALLGFGNMVLLRHANGFMTAYAHNEVISVSRGDTVRRGQVIATVGSSGNVSSPQLHFEIRKGKRAIDPLKYLPALSTKS